MNAVSLKKEQKLKREGIKYIAGVDEAGIGPLAGPIVAAAVILKDSAKIKGLDDSKKLSPKKREELYNIIIDASVSIGICIIDNATIDKINILQASLRAMEAAVMSLSIKPGHVLVDGIRKLPNIKYPQTAIKFGDGISSSIAAASVIAKVTRDTLMHSYDLLYPKYDFSLHKGYGTKLHMKRLKKHGPSPIHRLSYQPVKDSLKVNGILFI
jgi:ribonuclease HII